MARCPSLRAQREGACKMTISAVSHADWPAMELCDACAGLGYHTRYYNEFDSYDVECTKCEGAGEYPVVREYPIFEK